MASHSSRFLLSLRRDLLFGTVDLMDLPVAGAIKTQEQFLPSDILLRKEVIQPQVPLRLPCYDFIPITIHTLGTCPPCGLARRLRVQTAFMM